MWNIYILFHRLLGAILIRIILFAPVFQEPPRELHPDQHI